MTQTESFPSGWTLFASSTRQQRKNYYYTKKIVIDSPETLVWNALIWDHISVETRDRRRTKKVKVPMRETGGVKVPCPPSQLRDFYAEHHGEVNLVSCDVLKVDLDNGHTDIPEEWDTIEKVLAFAEKYDLPVIIAGSKSHLIDKLDDEGELIATARPRFHAYFPTERAITDPDEADYFHKALYALFGYTPDTLGYVQYFAGFYPPDNFWGERLQWRDGDGGILELLKNAIPPDVVKRGGRKTIQMPRKRSGTVSGNKKTLPGVVSRNITVSALYDDLKRGYVWASYKSAYPISVWRNGGSGFRHDTLLSIAGSLAKRIDSESLHAYIHIINQALATPKSSDEVDKILEWVKGGKDD